LLYLGSGIGLWLWRRWQRAAKVHLPQGERLWLAGAIVAGGVVGPVLLMIGLSAMQATAASLLLNAESVFTALLAWFVFKENFDRRIALGMASIVAGAVVLSWPSEDWSAGAVRTGCVLCLGDRQQPDAQGVVERCHVHRHGEGVGGGCDQPGSGGGG